MAANTLSYSESGLRVKAAFYNKKAMVYVEGTDDIIFWEQFFDKQVYKVEDVGGCGNFKSYIQRLNNGEKSFVVAGDLDYSTYKSPICTSKLYVTTYCHSIENMMYCPHNINHAVQRLARDSRIDSIGEIEDFYNRFIAGVENLLILDAANNIYNKGVSILGDSCYRFLDKDNLPEIDSTLVNNFYNSKVGQFEMHEINAVKTILQTEPRPKRLLIKYNTPRFSDRHNYGGMTNNRYICKKEENQNGKTIEIYSFFQGESRRGSAQGNGATGVAGQEIWRGTLENYRMEERVA